MAAICSNHGHCEVIAGPGSGKTFVLVEHILYLIQVCGVSPHQILVLTFGRAAALQMRERFLRRLGSDNPGVTFGTFHSVFYQILRENSGRNLRLISASQKERLLSALLEDYFPDRSSQPTSEDLERKISRCRALQTASHRNVSEPGDSAVFARLLDEYERYLLENGLLDFDDMIAGSLALLRSRPNVLQNWQSRYTQILVDEFQDINLSQYEILRLLAAGSGLFVVGDDDQTIYGFRGSSPAVMQKFMKDYPRAQQIFLSVNYRSSGCIVSAADRLISENSLRISKEIKSAGKAGDMVQVRHFPSQREEFAYLAAELSGFPLHKLSDCAVIFRTNSHVLSFSGFLKKNGILCVGSGTAQSRIEELIMRDVLAYYQLSEQLQQRKIRRQTLYQVMNRPERCILRSIASKETVSPEAMMAQTANSPSRLRILQELLKDLSVLHSLSAEGFLRYLFYSMGYAQWACCNLGDRSVVEQLLCRMEKDASGMSRIGIRDYLLQRQRALSAHSSCSDTGVHVLTMHGSKGLEFDRVYLPELNEGIIPGRRCKKEYEIEEERRLLYVAMTRARNHLELLYLCGTAQNPRMPSRFLKVFGIKG